MSDNIFDDILYKVRHRELQLNYINILNQTNISNEIVLDNLLRNDINPYSIDSSITSNDKGKIIFTSRIRLELEESEDEFMDESKIMKFYYTTDNGTSECCIIYIYQNLGLLDDEKITLLNLVELMQKDFPLLKLSRVKSMRTSITLDNARYASIIFPCKIKRDKNILESKKYKYVKPDTLYHYPSNYKLKEIVPTLDLLTLNDI